MYSNINQSKVKKDDLVLIIQKSQIDKSLTGRMFLYEKNDGGLVIGKRAIELKPPINFGDIEMPNPQRIKSDWEDGYFRFPTTADEIYVGLEDVHQGLLSHQEFEAYGAVADYYKRLLPKLSRFHEN